MELLYILIAVAIIVLPFVLTRLFAARSKEPKAALGATPAPKPEPTAAPSDPLRAQVAQLLAQGGKMEAIKLMRDKRDLPLAEAKAAVEAIGKDAAIVLPAP